MNTNAQLRPFVLSGGGSRGFAHLGVLKAGSYFVEPSELGKFGMFEFGKLEAIYETGLGFTSELLDGKPV